MADQTFDSRTPLERFQDENRELLRSYAAENARMRDAMRLLIRNDQFKVYLDAINRMVQMRADELMAPLPSMDATLRQEFVKGAMSGLILARDLPSLTIAVMHNPSEDDEC